MQQNYPKDLTDYYRSHPETFELRSDKTKKTLNIILLLIFLVILIYPEIAIKKFSSSSTNEEEIRNFLENNDFQRLANIPSAENQPLQLYIHEDKDGKSFYLLLMKYYSKSEFSGASTVKVISGADYIQYKDIIRSIQ